MNNPHKNPRTTPLGRAEMIRRIEEDGRPVAEVAAGFGVSERTARKWLSRWRTDGRAGLENRSSRPHASRSPMHGFWAQLTARLRRDYRLTGEEIASRLGLARSTVAGWLTRMGLGQLSSLDPQEPVGRYQRERAFSSRRSKKLERFEGVGHSITGKRRGASKGLGYDCLHGAIHDAHPARRYRGPGRRATLVDHRPPCPGAALVRGAVRPRRMDDDRRRLGLHCQALPHGLADARHPAHPHPPLHPAASGRGASQGIFGAHIQGEFNAQRQHRQPWTCRNDQPGTNRIDLVLAFQHDFRLKPAPDQPNQNSQLGGVLTTCCAIGSS